MGQFMQRRAVKIDRLVKAVLFGDADVVAADVVIGLLAAALKHRAARLDQQFGAFDGKAVRDRRKRRRHVGGQAFALGDVENCKAFQKRDAAGFAIFAARRFLLALGREAVGKNNSGAVFALADIAAD